MSARIRIGPFTVGRTGVRLSKWMKFGGVSIPLNPMYTDKKGNKRESHWQALGRVGPVRGHKGGSLMKTIRKLLEG